MAGIANLFALIDRLKRNAAKNIKDPIGTLEAGVLALDEDFKQDPVNTILGSANIGGGLLGMTKLVKPPKAPQADALETARRNAVEMLGLPENNTAMDRAKAMGFDAEGYHITTSNLGDVFDVSKTSANSKYGQGMYLLPDTKRIPFLSRMIANRGGSEEGLNVLPVVVRKGNMYNPDELGEFIGAPSREAMLKRGYSGVQDKGEMAIYEPERVRSCFAAFDPARVNENNLLASRLLPLALPGLLFAGDEEE